MKGKRKSSQMYRGVLEMMILGLLLEKDSYGYEIIETINEYLPISEGSVYPLLRRFLKEGLVKTYLSESSSGPPRKYYQISPEGEELFKNSQEEYKILIASVDRFLEERM